jgi:serine/threonine-protein kinase
VAGQVIRAEHDGMGLVFIPQGSFTMGWKFGDPGEFPEHRVTLDAFWIDKTEVTNRMYAACVSSGACELPANLASYKHQDYYANPEYAEFPVVYVNWQQATAYCAWADRRLPTEAEWEYAARGEENRLYPWGKEAPSKELANFNHLFIDTTRVGSFPDGASPYGVLDMAGNVAEWVSDWYFESYYARSAKENPQGPAEGMVRAFRGGSFANVGEKIRSSRRVHDDAIYSSSSLGFRCAKDAP